ncbi:DUF481 domain-containing protein [Sphingomonas sp.]|uniref:DUF481 domain-containing protein n=1 Tax=Sphingomonas sp. TaxID=28214 RepID=UPI002DD6B0D7|nr:DUF481 domain-containing protein [Sphingomonas sp.]
MRVALLPLSVLLLANTDPAPVAADPVEIPQAIRTMLDAAMASGSEAEVNTIAKYASTAAPESAALIRRAALEWKQDRAAAAHKTLIESGFFDLVRGKAEIGGFFTTGNTNNVGVTGTVELKRDGIQWRHNLKMLAEYQESAGVVSREHYLISYQPNYKFSDRAYVYGAGQYEEDRFLGYFSRYALSAGAGYTVVKTPSVSLDLELGPSFRRTEFTDLNTERELGARGRIDFDWRLGKGVTLSQDAAAYLQNLNSTVTTRTALAAKLFGPLSAQMSYAVSYESRPPRNRVNTDTTSRASLVYAF